jgi:endonuclease/exonuclease/phosphatase (EEP) superfamily protein YafD
MSAGFKDAYRQCGFGPEITYNANKLYFRIDHILYRGDMDAINIRRGKLKSSDHYPLLATFLWIPPDNK